jgi:hypothetical protein
MTDRINLYPKTSCPCEESSREYKIPTDGPKSNISIRGYKPSPYFNYYDRVELKREQQPQAKEGRYQLNPQSITNKLAPDFGMIPCQTASTCPNPSWISWDPRLFSSTRANWIPLDGPPTHGRVRLKNLYKDGYTYDSAIGFQSYDQIGDGNITYYIDTSIEDAFFHPVFSEPATEQAELFVDPMGGIKPEYNRRPLINTENPAVTTPESYPYCLSSIQDSQSFREDLMALQTRKSNQSKWSARWANETM